MRAAPKLGKASSTVTGENDAAEVTKAVAFVLRSTQQRPQTEAELRRKLSAREVEDAVAQAAMTRAQEVGAVDDAAFARAWVNDRGGMRGYGVARLRRELRQRLVPEPLAEDALGLLDDRDEWAVAMRLACSRARALPATLEAEAVARRLLAHLVRRGHPPSLAQSVAIEVSGLDRAWD